MQISMYCFSCWYNKLNSNSLPLDSLSSNSRNFFLQLREYIHDGNWRITYEVQEPIRQEYVQNIYATGGPVMER
jgi:hypothetical protein